MDLARAFGIDGCDLGMDPEALAHALRTPGPRLIVFRSPKEEQVLPMVPPGAANTQALDHDGPS